MQVFSDIKEFRNRTGDGVKTAVAIGKFDGIHKGHHRLIEEITSCKEQGIGSLVFTFKSPIGDFFTKERSKVLSTEKEKISLLEEMGVDYLYLMKVNKESVSYAPEYFVKDVLCQGLGAAMIAAGCDLSFGRGGEGDMALVNRMAGELSFEARMIPHVMYKGNKISSTLIREAVLAGRMEEAGEMLSRPYSIEGEITYGRQLGRTIDMPTANVIPEDDKLLPPFGVYFSRVTVGDETYRGLTNVGIKPTVSDEDKVCVETYIYGLDRDIYGKHMSVGLLHFVRPEMRFPNIEMLKKQMHDDSIKGISYFEKTEKI